MALALLSYFSPDINRLTGSSFSHSFNDPLMFCHCSSPVTVSQEKAEESFLVSLVKGKVTQQTRCQFISRPPEQQALFSKVHLSKTKYVFPSAVLQQWWPAMLTPPPLQPPSPCACQFPCFTAHNHRIRLHQCLPQLHSAQEHRPFEFFFFFNIKGPSAEIRSLLNKQKQVKLSPAV